ncbi:outer membrane protein [Yoonia sp. 208BN28-4]|uniref:outer membrane protein n=1 Tax=Yoonia sp. 208BN28-4 TaxID=3126505 RepID=UPI00309BC8FE
MSTFNKFTRAAVVAIPAAFAGVTAQAGGLAEPAIAPVAVAPAPVYVAPTGRDWTGFYVGGSLGYGQLEGDGLGDDFSGTIYSGHAGYNYDLGSYVIGAELEGTFGQIDDDTSGLDFENVLRAKARAGYDAGVFLPYVTAGYAQATVSAGDADIDDNGYFYGAGVDYAVTDSITVGGEVLQHEFNDFNGGSDVSALTASLRVSYNF